MTSGVDDDEYVMSSLTDINNSIQELCQDTSDHQHDENDQRISISHGNTDNNRKRKSDRSMDKHRNDRRVKQERYIEEKARESHLRCKKNMAVGIWRDCIERVEIVKMKGNFWKTCGYNVGTLHYLLPEEALNLQERSQICIEYPGFRSSQSNDIKATSNGLNRSTSQSSEDNTLQTMNNGSIGQSSTVARSIVAYQGLEEQSDVPESPDIVSIQEFYEIVISKLDFVCYLVFIKLKVTSLRLYVLC